MLKKMRKTDRKIEIREKNGRNLKKMNNYV